MSFAIVHGDLFNESNFVIMHGVNSRGIVESNSAEMASGCPTAMGQYVREARRGVMLPGTALMTDDVSNRVVIHCVIQDDPGNCATETWLRESLKSGLDQAHSCSLETVYTPLIGVANGLDSVTVEKIISEVASCSPVEVMLVK